MGKLKRWTKDDFGTTISRHTFLINVFTRSNSFVCLFFSLFKPVGLKSLSSFGNSRDPDSPVPLFLYNGIVPTLDLGTFSPVGCLRDSTSESVTVDTVLPLSFLFIRSEREKEG